MLNLLENILLIKEKKLLININNIGLENNNNGGLQSENQPNNLEFLNGENNNIYQQLSHDQM